jgi:hypothetical protein
MRTDTHHISLRALLLLVAVSFVSILIGSSTHAADFTITVTDSAATQNQTLIYSYQNIGPGFSQNTPIIIDNQATGTTKIVLAGVTANPLDANALLPFARLTLTWGPLVLGEGAFDADTLIGATFCAAANTTETLQAGFSLPASVGNTAQDTSMAVEYEFFVEQTPCEVTELPPEPPELPPTGESMLSFYILGGITVIFAALTILFIILTITQRRKRSRKEK